MSLVLVVALAAIASACGSDDPVGLADVGVVSTEEADAETSSTTAEDDIDPESTTATTLRESTTSTTTTTTTTTTSTTSTTTTTTAPPPTQLPSPSSGAWDTNFGGAGAENLVVNLVFGGTALSGNYSRPAGASSVSGSYDPNTRTASGVWVQPASSTPCSTTQFGSEFWGRFTWVFAADGRSFTGTWSYCDLADAGEWNGTTST